MASKYISKYQKDEQRMNTMQVSSFFPGFQMKYRVLSTGHTGCVQVM